MPTRRFTVEILGEARKLNRTVDQVDNRLARFGKNTERVGHTVTAIGAGFVASKVVEGLNAAGQAASDLNETTSKTQVVFGRAADVVFRFGKTSATSVGLSTQAAEEAAATFGNLFVAMKIGQKPAADMSVGLVKLAGDLASFNNVSPEQVLADLRSGLVGEVEPLRKYGVALNAASVEQEAMRETGKRNVKQLTEADKVTARYNLILKNTTTAQGDFARTSAGQANSQRILNAEWKNAQAQFGKALLPAMLTGVKVGNQLLGTFTDLDSASHGMVTNVALAGGALAATAIAGGKAIKMARDAKVAFDALNLSMTLGKAGPLGVAVGVVAIAGVKLKDSLQAAAAENEKFGRTAVVGGKGGQLFADRVSHVTRETRELVPATSQAAEGTAKVGGSAAGAAPKIESTAHALRSYRIALHASNVKLGEAIPLFEGYRREADVTGKAIVRHLREEVGAYGTWAKDTQTLLKRGANPQFIRELSQKGPAYVHAMATASDTQLALAQKFFKLRMAEIRRLSEAQLRAAGRNAPAGFAAAMTAQGGLVGRAATRTASRAVGPFRGVRDDARSWGSGLSGNFAAGISSRSSLDAARKASRRLGISVTNLLRFSAGPTEGPLAEGGGPYVWGQHFAEKYAAGMASKYGLMSAAATGLGDAGAMPKGGSVAAIVRSIAERRGWGHGAQWAALSQLISHESGWRPTAQNPTSTAYGLFQFLNSTWAGVGGHKTSDPGLQTLYGLRYIAGRYGSPVGAWNFWQGHHWYGSGLPPTLFDKPTLIGVGERGPETVTVTPGRAGGGEQHLHVHFHGTVIGGDIRKVAADLAPPIRQAIRAQQRREGVKPSV